MKRLHDQDIQITVSNDTSDFSCLGCQEIRNKKFSIIKNLPHEKFFHCEPLLFRDKLQCGRERVEMTKLTSISSHDP